MLCQEGWKEGPACGKAKPSTAPRMYRVYVMMVAQRGCVVLGDVWSHLPCAQLLFPLENFTQVVIRVTSTQSAAQSSAPSTGAPPDCSCEQSAPQAQHTPGPLLQPSPQCPQAEALIN